MIPLNELIICASRELRMRKSVYSDAVKRGSMNKSKADYEIACMAAILDNLMAQNGESVNQKNLFGGVNADPS